MLKVLEKVGDLALVLAVLCLIILAFNTSKNIKLLADKVNELSEQTIQKPVVSYTATAGLPWRFTNVVTRIEINP